MPWKSPDEADAFVARYADTILRLALTYSLSRADAQDVCQDVFCRLLQSDLNFDSPAAERAYVIRSAINACKDVLKSAWRRRHTALDHACHIPAPVPPAPDDTLLRAVRALPVRDREVIHLYYYEGYDTGEIAALTGVSPAAVRKRLCRARDKLRHELEGSDYETLY